MQQELIKEQLKPTTQKLTMTETLERVLAPLLTFHSFFNLGMFEYPRGQSRTYLSCLYALAKWGSLTYFFYYPLFATKYHNIERLLTVGHHYINYH